MYLSYQQEPVMEYIKIRFGDDWERLGSGFERTLDSIFRSVNPMFADCDQPWNPQMDVYETPTEVFMIAEIAGVDKDDLDVEINNKAVKISGRRMPAPRAAEASFRLAEIPYGSFERVYFLPAVIDPEVVSATYANGLLQLRLAKALPTRPRRIPISED
jgi:HSP20 family protein